MPRPTIPIEGELTRDTHFRLTEQHRELLTACAKRRRMTVGQLLRYLIEEEAAHQGLAQEEDATNANQ